MHATASIPPFIASHALLVFLLQVGLLLLTALLLARLATRLGMPAIVGELCAGLLLGPTVLSRVAPDLYDWLIPRSTEQFHMLDAVGQIGVLLLVGITGAHLDLGEVRAQRATAIRVSVCGLVIPLGLGIAAGALLPVGLVGEGDRWTTALFLGVAMSVSAIPVIAKTLMDMDLLHRKVGQLTLAAGMIDDAFAWVMLSVLSAMATTGLRTGTVVWALADLALVILFAAVVGRPLIRGTFAALHRRKQGPQTALVVVIAVLLSAAATTALGLEAIFGAFVCGVLISRYGHPDPAAFGALRSMVLSVLAPVFFATVGLRMDLLALTDTRVLLTALALLCVAVLGKFLGAYVGARTSRLSRWEGLALGAGMNARGVVEVVVAMVGLRLGILTPEMYTIVVLIAAVTSMMAPPMLRVAMARIGPPDADERRRRDQTAAALPTTPDRPGSGPVHQGGRR
ncbi:cation:proton antiporter [Streptomyces sp. NPDC058676]|uniref:cation:proton antiporter n=1 Tax=unclassified Streptomyces TaxID=2593676 RepID=UPI00366177AC